MYDRLRKLANASGVQRFDIAGRQIFGTFTYAKLPMVRDLQSADDLLAESDIVAALAGDPEAQAALAMGRDDTDHVEDIEPRNDYFVLDANSSQQKVINRVLHGQSLVIHGPPGTGKSQTIANLIAVLVAHNKKVLFVAEKRAASTPYSIV